MDRKYLDPADAKISNLGAAIYIKQDILWLQVPVYNTGMQVGQALRHVMRNLQMTVHVSSAMRHPPRVYSSCFER